MKALKDLASEIIKIVHREMSSDKIKVDRALIKIIDEDEYDLVIKLKVFIYIPSYVDSLPVLQLQPVSCY